LSPFDIQLRAVERQLDFSDAGKAMSRFLANRNRRLFSMSTENALVTLLREGVSVQESSVDSKRDLEDALRSACNDFIEHTATSVAGSVLTFVDQCKGCNEKDALPSQPFASGLSVKEVMEKACEGLEERLQSVVTQMGLYLEHSGTQSILLKPVIRKIMRAMEESKRVMDTRLTDDQHGWDASLRSEIKELMSTIDTTLKRSTSKTTSSTTAITAAATSRS
jgi:hypothetical protein